jgi:hypothetical protein
MACASIVAVVSLVVSPIARAWDEKSGDMPWLGKGGRAHYYTRETSCMMCTTGSRVENRWGRSSFSGEDPYQTVGKAMGFLAKRGALAKAAHAIGSGSVSDGTVTIEPKALPYRLTVVMLEPTVIVMNFDLGALVHEGQPTQGQIIGTPALDAYVSYGTRVPATGTLVWFSPDLDVAPTPVSGQASGVGEIDAGGAKLTLERRNDEWIVTHR